MSGLIEQSVFPSFPSFPYDVAVDIIARVPISDYPTLYNVSKSFRELTASSVLYEERTKLGLKGHQVYAVLYSRKNYDFRFYTLQRKLKGGNRLVVIPSLPPMNSYPSCVSAGPKVYVFNELSAGVIDCRSLKCERIPKMPLNMFRRVANVIDGKVYLSGFKYPNKVVRVFDTETQTWESVKEEDGCFLSLWSDAVVMEDKIYMKDYGGYKSFVYGPGEKQWESMDEVLNSRKWSGGCVVDDVLYYLDCSDKALLMAFDPKPSAWSVVKGLDELSAVMETAECEWSKAVKCDEKKLALFFPKNNDGKEVICCAEIALERRPGGEIWGEMESFDDDVVDGDGLLKMDQCVSVTFDAA